MLRINEIFDSIQGEGANTGIPATFIRLADCNRRCSFCDTDFSCKVEMTAKQLCEETEKHNIKNIIITGGEPLLQINELKPFMKMLSRDKMIYLETNGDLLSSKSGLGFNYITVSPKDMNFFHREDVLDWVDEIKLVWTGKEDLDIIERVCESNMVELFLQPCDGMNNVEEVVEIVKRKGGIWRLSLQTHKLIGIR